MKLRFFRRNKWDDFKGIRERSTIIRSAEAAWPIRGDTRTSAEHLERIRRAHRRREEYRQRLLANPDDQISFREQN